MPSILYPALQLCWLRVPEAVELQGLDLAQGLSTGLVGRCLTNSAYTMAVESSLHRPSAMPPAGGAGAKGRRGAGTGIDDGASV